jgi:hypothetical protein
VIVKVLTKMSSMVRIRGYTMLRRAENLVVALFVKKKRIFKMKLLTFLLVLFVVLPSVSFARDVVDYLNHWYKLPEDSLIINTNNTWILVNRSEITLYLMMDSDTIWKAKCGIGTGKVLEYEDKVWQFGTPEGERKVIKKIINPVWIKPDWAFIEEGKPIPPESDTSRYVREHLGKYKLDLGDDVGIHGIRGDKVEGRVSHGCIRLNDEDLEIVWRYSKVGTKVLIK